MAISLYSFCILQQVYRLQDTGNCFNSSTFQICNSCYDLIVYYVQNFSSLLKFYILLINLYIHTEGCHIIPSLTPLYGDFCSILTVILLQSVSLTLWVRIPPRRGVLDTTLYDKVLCHFQQYFSYIVTVSFIGAGNRSTRRKPRPAASHWQTLSYKGYPFC
jgi:hypothetical protein